MNFDDYYYIPLREGGKKPRFAWGGYPVDPDREHIYEFHEVVTHDHRNWGIIGNRDKNLLIIDIDSDEMSEDELKRIEKGWGNLLDVSPVVRTQSGGLHIYVKYDKDEEDPDIKSIDHVDLKGEMKNGHGVAPFSPGYELTNDTKAVEVEFGNLVDLPVIYEDASEFEEVSEQYLRDNSTVPPCVSVAFDEINQQTDNRGNAWLFLRKFLRRFGALTEDKQDDIEMDNTETPSIYNLSELGAYEEAVRDEAPRWMHDTPSSSGMNFMIDDGGETFRCWRHNTTGFIFHLIGIKHDVIECGEWENGGLSSSTWSEIFEYAEEYGLSGGESLTLACDEIEDLELCPYNCGKNYPTEGVLLGL